MTKSGTFRLFQETPSFSRGFSSILGSFENIENKFNIDKTEIIADSKAVESDWQMVGKDMRVALDKHERGQG
jgi:hypothetical protein